jgi:GTP-binding protein EngB required for normal cell division
MPFPVGTVLPAVGGSTGTYHADMPSDPLNEVEKFGNSLAGFSEVIRSLAPAFNLGEVSYGPGNTWWVYVQASAAIAGAATVKVPVAIAISATFVASAGTGYMASAPFAINECGWVRKTAGLV